MSTSHWHYKKTEPFVPQGKDTTRPNFSREERTETAILIREGLQNPLDARESDGGLVRVVMKSLEPGSFDSKYLRQIVPTDFQERLKAASDVDLPDIEQASVFIIEDFGTKGLQGNAEDYDADGPGQNWNAFWHREGEGAKGRASNGGAGQGKVTYYAHSNASVVFGLTVRAEDKKRLLMGRAAFVRDYPYKDGHKYIRTAYWTTSDDKPLPESNLKELDRFCTAFNLTRKEDCPGLSLVVPFSKKFETKEAITAVILDFYMPIAAGRLDVMVAGTHLSSKTIDAIADRFIDDHEALRASVLTQRFLLTSCR